MPIVKLDRKALRRIRSMGDGSLEKHLLNISRESGPPIEYRTAEHFIRA